MSEQKSTWKRLTDLYPVQHGGICSASPDCHKLALQTIKTLVHSFHLQLIQSVNFVQESYSLLGYKSAFMH